MPLTAEEKVRIKFHLGYPIQTVLRSMFMGMPMQVESNWQIDAMLATPLMEETLPLIRDCIKQCDQIMFEDFPDARLEHKAEQLEELRLNMKHTVMLSEDFTMWQHKLAQCLCVPINPDFAGPREAYQGTGNFSWSW